MNPLRILLHILTLALIGALVFAASGCATTRTPRPPWQSAYEAEITPIIACWQRELGRTDIVTTRPLVIERTDCLYSERAKLQYFAYPPSPTGFATGCIDSGVVYVCPDRKALGHELSHWVRWYYTGSYGRNGEGRCGL